MYIFLDEPYNLKDRSKKQFISINGFSVLDEKALLKKWKDYRRPFLTKKRRIHATDNFFNKLRLKALKLIDRPNLILLSVFQIIQEISFKNNNAYSRKGKLNFDKVYFDMLIELFKSLNLGEYRNVTITIDSRKHKGGVLGKNLFEKHVLDFLKMKYQRTKFIFILQPSSSNALLELADFISNIFYRAYAQNNKQFFQGLCFNIIQIKNPLK